ncbi:rRNA pseudouridine synthase [candidate division FCPU426 bacterium]|nr:rRNA pseudouridine synthase [candidate division FCPU426 bacterium]
MQAYPFLWLAMNKPAEVTTTRKEDWGRKTVYDLLPPGLPRVEAVGRLDRATTGLLLFTNDFRLAQKLLDPGNKIPRVYQVVTNKPLPEDIFAAMRRGVTLKGGTACNPFEVQKTGKPADGRSYQFCLREGKYREVRRLVMHWGCKVRGLHRLRFGPISLGTIKSGSTRRLDGREVNQLRKMLS